MKILFISDNFPPEVNAPASRTYEHASEWVKSGADVTVITCFPNFPGGKIYGGHKNRLFQKEVIGGVKVLRVWSFISANEGFVPRILDYISFAITSFIAGLFMKTEVIVATSPQFFTTISAFLLSKLKCRPWVFELRDLWPASIRAVGAIKNSRILRILENMELLLYGDCDLVIALTDSFKRDLVLRGISGDKIKIVPNGVNMSIFYPRARNMELLKKYGLEGKFVIGYIGTHGMAHGLDFIVKASDKIKNSDIHFLFVGGGAEKANILNIARSKRLNNATFLDPIPKEEVPGMWSVIDAALIPLKKSDVFETVLPSKIFEASAMEKPILLGVGGEAKRVIEKYGAGICFEPENEADFILKVEEIKKNDSYRKLQAGTKRLAADYDRKALAAKMLEYLHEVAHCNIN